MQNLYANIPSLKGESTVSMLLGLPDHPYEGKQGKIQALVNSTIRSKKARKTKKGVLMSEEEVFRPPSGHVKIDKMHAYSAHPSGPQITRLWAISVAYSWSPQEVFAYCRTKYSKRDVTELLVPEYHEFCAHMEKGGRL